MKNGPKKGIESRCGHDIITPANLDIMEIYRRKSQHNRHLERLYWNIIF
jgi:hypothetical protein